MSIINNCLLKSQKLVNVWGKLAPAKSLRFISSVIDSDVIEIEDQSPQKFEKSVNEIKLLGRVGNDPVRVNTNGKEYAKFILATNRKWKSADGEKRATDWHNIIAYDQNLINYIGNYVQKGQRLYLSGRLSYFSPEGNSQTKVAYISLTDLISVQSSDTK